MDKYILKKEEVSQSSNLQQSEQKACSSAIAAGLSNVYVDDRRECIVYECENKPEDCPELKVFFYLIAR